MWILAFVWGIPVALSWGPRSRRLRKLLRPGADHRNDEFRMYLKCFEQFLHWLVLCTSMYIYVLFWGFVISGRMSSLNKHFWCHKLEVHSNPIFQTQVLDSSHFREFHHPTGSAFFQQLEALNGSSLSEAVSHIKVKYAGKDAGKRRCWCVTGWCDVFFWAGFGVKMQLDFWN